MSYYNPPYTASKIIDLRKGRPASARRNENDLLKDLTWEQIVSNSKDIYRNGWILKAIENRYTSYITHSGLTITGGDPLLQTAFNAYCSNAHISGMKDFDSILRNIIKMSIVNGDALIVFPTSSHDDGGIYTKIDVIDSARVRTPDNFLEQDSPKGKVINGVCFDKSGLEIGYYVLKRDARDNSVSSYNYWPRYTSAGKLNAYLFRNPQTEQAGLVRGLPLVTSIIREIYDLQKLAESSLDDAYNKSLLGLILTSRTPADVLPSLGAEDADGNAREFDLSYLSELESGIINLPENVDVKSFSHSGNSDLIGLINETLKHIASACGLPAFLLTHDFSDVNFSSARMGFDSFCRVIDTWINTLDHMIKEIYRAFTIEYSLINDLDITSDSISYKKLIGPPKPEPNPSQTANYFKTMLELGLISESEITGLRGQSYKDLLQTMQRDEQEKENILSNVININKDQDEEEQDGF